MMDQAEQKNGEWQRKNIGHKQQATSMTMGEDTG